MMSQLPVNKKITNKTPVTISARGKVLGRLATEIATILRGKDSVHFEEYLLSGRPVIVTHAKDVLTTGNKIDQKMYHRHSGYIGGLTSLTMRELKRKDSTEVIRHAVRGMLPSNRLRKHWMAQLEIREEE